MNEHTNHETAPANVPALRTETTPVEIMGRAGSVADACRQIVGRTVSTIQGRKYVQIEGWEAIAVAHGCALSAVNVERIEGGIRAIGEVRRMSDGHLIATAEGFVGDDEKTWKSRPEYAKRAMAQTRAMSRAARSSFAHVIVMMDDNLSTTPAEEIEPDDSPAPASATQNRRTGSSQRKSAPPAQEDLHYEPDNTQLDFETRVENLVEWFSKCKPPVDQRGLERFSRLGRKLWSPVTLEKFGEAARLIQSSGKAPSEALGRVFGHAAGVAA